MPYVLQHQSTTQIYTCTLVNHYGLAYYGVKFWQDQQEAKEEYPIFLNSVEMNEEEWRVIELEEGEMKLCNVKLRNDPNLQLFWLHTRKSEVRLLEK